MDKFMNGTAGFGTSSGLGQPGASELEANTLTQSSDTTGIEAKQTELRESFKVNDGTQRFS